MKVLLVIPAYNCEPQIGRVLAGISPELAAELDTIAVIDNQSTDATFAAAVRSAETLPFAVSVLKNQVNINLGGTHKVAFHAAKSGGYDYLAILHGDDQGTAESFRGLLEQARKNPRLAAALGARFMPGARLRGYPAVRTLGNRVINAVFSAVSGRRVYDLGSGLNLFKVSDIDLAEINRFGNGLAFNIDLLLYFLRRKSEIAFVPISWREEDQLSNARCFRQGFAALKTLFSWRFGLAAADHSLPPEIIAATFGAARWPAQLSA